MMGREGTTELEIDECQSPRRVPFVSAAGGTTWDRVPTLSESDVGTRVKQVVHVRDHHNFAAGLNRPIRQMIVKAVEADPRGLKHWCEAGVSA